MAPPKPLRGKGFVTGARTRTDPPDVDDPGLVVRPIGPFGPVTLDWGTSTLENGTETIVTNAVAVQVLAVNAARKSARVQNIGTVPARVGPAGVTATTGIRLLPNQAVLFVEPFIETQAIFAISEGADTVTLSSESV